MKIIIKFFRLRLFVGICTCYLSTIFHSNQSIHLLGSAKLANGTSKVSKASSGDCQSDYNYI